jgi:GT2 family glycosyltransferase
MNKLSVVLVTRNSGSTLSGCLRSLASKDPITAPANAEWLIVDNNSSDGSIAAALLQYPNIKVIQNTENKGFALAANQGWRAAENEFVLFINTDTELLNEAVSKMAQTLTAEPSVGAIGPRLLRKDGSIQKSVWPEPTIFTELFKPWFKLIVSVSERSFKDEKWYAVTSLRGAAFLTTKKVLSLVGGLDERYFFYLEETDLFHTMKAHGLKIAYLPAARITHFGGLGCDNANFDKAKMYRQSLMKYFLKNRPRWEAKALELYWSLSGRQL